MTPRARTVVFAALVAAAVAACGQTGPLELPENARPIERVDAPEGPEQQQPTDDERQDER